MASIMADLIPYPAIERHAVIGDRRTAALVAADGTIDWLCLPDYDGTVVFGALLDSGKGGFWRVGPSELRYGQQDYVDDAPIVVTKWSSAAYELELLDAMALPHDHRQGRDDERIVLRRLRCVRGSVRCVSVFRPAADFAPVEPRPQGSFARAGRYQLWGDHASLTGGSGIVDLTQGDTIWMVLATGASSKWTDEEAERLLRDVRRFWCDAMDRMVVGRSHDALRRSIVAMRLLEYAPAGSVVAAPTTSVPERIGGSWNADYRLTWLRDASLAMGMLAALGDLESASRYLTWLADRPPAAHAPLQVLYDIHGRPNPRQRERCDLDGYRGSKPVRFGNHAFQQKQLDSFGYLADCVWEYIERGGRWSTDFSDLMFRIADHVAAHWTEEGNGIWELSTTRHYTSSRVMSWATLDRALRICSRLEARWPGSPAWKRARDDIRREIETSGWSERLGAFKQSFENDALDASALLIPIVGFLPATDPRVLATIDRIGEHLTIDGCVYRFDPEEVPVLDPAAMGQYEAAFLPCTFWLATACAMAGRTDAAASILNRAEAVAGPLGLYAEAIDARSGTFAGNSPLLFSHAEHIRAVRALDLARTREARH
jgi:GH15 family glucan-1,4-alpha-glucosidase